MFKQLIFISLLFCLPVFGQIYSDPNTDVTNGLIAHWKLDELSYDGTVGEVKDSSGNGNNGTSVGKVITNPGKIGRAGYFDDGKYVSTGLNMLTGSDLTITAWCTPEDISQDYRWVVSQDDGGYDWGLLWEWSVNIPLQWMLTTGRSFWGTGVPVTFGKRVFVVGVWKVESDIEFYIDGQRHSLGSAPSISSSTLLVDLGRSPVTADQRYKGLIDDVRIYNRALSSNEVYKLYNLGTPKHQTVAYNIKTTPYEMIPTNGLVAHWKLDELSYNGTAGEVKDSSGNGNNGTSFGKVITNPGKIGRAGYFDGQSCYISLENSVNNLKVDIGSFSAWFNTSNNSGMYMFYRYRFYGYGLGLYPGGNVYFGGYYSSTISFDLISPLTYNDGKWHLATATSDGFVTLLYVDGTLVASENNGDGSFYYGDGYSAIGRAGNYDGDYFNGSIDDVRIYNRALSSNEVSNLYNLGTPKHQTVAYSISNNKTNICAVYIGNKLISNPLKKSFKRDINEE